MTWARACALVLVIAAIGVPALAQGRSGEDLESFRVELTAGAWFLRPSGTVTSRGFTVDLESDLGIADNKGQFLGKLVFKPARKHRLVLEGTPYRLAGDNVLAREIRFGGSTYRVQDRITSNVEITYFFGGSQYDFVHRPRGHAGLLAGVGYMDASAAAQLVALGAAATASARVPYPLVGGEFRVFPIRASHLLSLEGEVKGMSFGDYGRYLDASFQAGLGLGRHLSLLAGYRVLDADVHTRDRSQGVEPRFRGPTVSLQVRDR